MNEHIKLTSEQAAQIKGHYGEYSALEPIAYEDGFIVPISVVDNPEFAEIKELLQCFAIPENIIIPIPSNETE